MNSLPRRERRYFVRETKRFAERRVILRPRNRHHGYFPYLHPIVGSVALDAVATGTQDSNGTVQGTNVDSTKHTMGSVSNGAMVVLLSFNNTAVSGVTVQWDALGSPQSFTQIKTANNPATDARVDVWGLVGPTAGNKTLRVKWTGGGTSDVGIFSVSYSGVDQTGGLTSFPHGNSNSGTSTSASVAITSATGNACVAGFAAPSSSFNTPNQTEIYSDANLTNINASGQRAAGAASVSFTYALANDSWVAVGCDILAASGTTLNFGWYKRKEDEIPKPILLPPDEARQFFVRSPNPVPTRWLPTAGGNDIDRPIPVRRFPDEPPQSFFVRSPVPVPTNRMLPTTGADRERLPPIQRTPDEPPGPWFVRSPNPVPTRWLPTTGMEDRLSPFRPDDSSIENRRWFARSPNPVPTTWLPTAGEHDHIKPILRSPDEPPQSFFIRSPNPVPTIWLPTTGQEDRLPPIKRSFDEPPGPWFVRSPSPVPIIWLPTTGEEDRPPIQKRSPDELNGFFFQKVSVVTPPNRWLPTTGEEDRLPSIQRSLDEATPFFKPSAAQVVGISGIGWYNPDFTQPPLPPVDPSDIQRLPPFVSPPLLTFMAQTNADDFNPLMPILPGDGILSLAPRVPPPPVGIAGIAWWQQAQTQKLDIQEYGDYRIGWVPQIIIQTVTIKPIVYISSSYIQ